jgi:hypothetical protein
MAAVLSASTRYENLSRSRSVRQNTLGIPMPKKRNSLVANINRRKRKGISRPKSKSSVSKQSYRQMQQGWPKAKKAKGKRAAAKQRTGTTAVKKKTTSKQSSGRGRSR